MSHACTVYRHMHHYCCTCDRALFPASGDEQGLQLLNLQKQKLEKAERKIDNKRDESILLMENVASDPMLSPAKKVIFAETMREVSKTGNVMATCDPDGENGTSRLAISAKDY